MSDRRLSDSKSRSKPPDSPPVSPPVSSTDIPFGNSDLSKRNGRAGPRDEPGCDDDIDDREFDPDRVEVRGAFERMKNLARSLNVRDADNMKGRAVDPAIQESMTDASHAERFAEAMGIDLRYDHRRDRWLYYEEPRWRPDINGAVYRRAIEFARMRQLQAVMITHDKKLRELVLRYFIAAESKAALDRTIALSRCMPPVSDDGDKWDLDPWVMGATNGVVNLRNGYISSGDPAHRITMGASVDYDPQATAPRWERFILEIFSGDADLAHWVHKFVGYAMSGVTTEQVLCFFYGRGANGKGTFMNTIAHILGDYAYNMPFSTVELKQRSAIPNDVAALDKRRWVTASETNDGTRLNESRIKALTGCDPITARFLHGEWFTFQPVAKFVLAVNHKPVVADDSYGFWRRIRLVPFLKSFQGAERDPSLEGFFKGPEAPGILRWMVDGCLAWQREGLGLPSAIANATSEYQSDSDALGDFMNACVEEASENEVAASAVQSMYVKWADATSLPKHERMNAKVLGQKLADKCQRRHTRAGWVYTGIRLVTSNLF